MLRQVGVATRVWGLGRMWENVTCQRSEMYPQSFPNTKAASFWGMLQGGKKAALLLRPQGQEVLGKFEGNLPLPESVSVNASLGSLHVLPD